MKLKKVKSRRNNNSSKRAVEASYLNFQMLNKVNMSDLSLQANEIVTIMIAEIKNDIKAYNKLIDANFESVSLETKIMNDLKAMNDFISTLCDDITHSIIQNETAFNDLVDFDSYLVA